MYRAWDFLIFRTNNGYHLLISEQIDTESRFWETDTGRIQLQTWMKHLQTLETPAHKL